MAEDPAEILSQQIDAKLGSYFEKQLQGVAAFGEYMAKAVSRKAPNRTGLLADQIDWSFTKVGDHKFPGYSKQAGVSGKALWRKIRDSKGRFAKAADMAITIGAINPTGWSYNFPVPYAGARDRPQTTIIAGRNLGVPSPTPFWGGKLAIPTPSPLGISAGIFGGAKSRGVPVYARDVISNPKGYGLDRVFPSKSGRAILGVPIGDETPSKNVNWGSRVLFALTDEYTTTGTGYLTETIEDEKSVATAVMMDILDRFKAE